MDASVMRVPRFGAGSRRPILCGTLLLAGWGWAGCGSSPTEPVSREAQFDRLWTAFDRHYSYFAYKQIDWDRAREEFRARAAAAPSQAALIGVFREMLAPLRDVHVALIAPGGTPTPTYLPTAPVNWSLAVWQGYLQRMNWTQRSNWGYGRWDGLAYVAIGSWSARQFRVEEFDAALEALRDSPALILDVRANPGGDDALAFQVAGRFADRERVVGYIRLRNGPGHDDFTPLTARQVGPRGSWQYLKPVVVLAGRGGFSSNESFLAAMATFPHVTVVGDTTGGGSGNPGSFEVGEGWSVTVSRWIEYQPDLTITEWNGVAPDIVVPWSAAGFAAGVDETLEFARTLAASSALGRISEGAAGPSAPAGPGSVGRGGGARGRATSGSG